MVCLVFQLALSGCMLSVDGDKQEENKASLHCTSIFFPLVAVRHVAAKNSILFIVT